MTTIETGAIKFPELVFATAGPIGVDMDLISSTLAACLDQVKYTSRPIKISIEMKRVLIEDNIVSRNDFHAKIDYANALRAKFKAPDLLARIAVEAIRSRRRAETGDHRKPASAFAYIVSQLKRPEEVDLLRTLYGRQFILVSAYASEVDRCRKLTHKLRAQLSTGISDAELQFEASSLMERDASLGSRAVVGKGAGMFVLMSRPPIRLRDRPMGSALGLSKAPKACRLRL